MDRRRLGADRFRRQSQTLGRKQDGQRINALSHLLMRDDDFDHAVLGELEPRAGIRKRLFQFNEVQNDQRELIFGQRIELMKDENVGEMVADMRRAFVEDVVTKHVPEHARAEQWDLAGLKEELKRVLEIDLPVDQWTGIAKRELLSRIERRADEKMLAKVTQWGADVMRYVEKTILLYRGVRCPDIHSQHDHQKAR
jgi:SecA Wing and Scaffold domain